MTITAHISHHCTIHVLNSQLAKGAFSYMMPIVCPNIIITILVCKILQSEVTFKIPKLTLFLNAQNYDVAH